MKMDERIYPATFRARIRGGKPLVIKGSLISDKGSWPDQLRFELPEMIVICGKEQTTGRRPVEISDTMRIRARFNKSLLQRVKRWMFSKPDGPRAATLSSDGPGGGTYVRTGVARPISIMCNTDTEMAEYLFHWVNARTELKTDK